MADVIDVVHKITYQVDDKALVNATSIIQHQLIELSEINKSIGVLQQQLQKVSASEVALIRQISDKTDKLFARLEANAGRTKGVLEQVGRGLLVGLGGTNGLESTVSRIIAPLATKLPEAALKGGSSILELGGKLLSFGNIVTASISILSTLTLEFLNSQKSVEGISAELAEAQEVLADFAQTASEDIGKFRSLYAVITDVNTSYSQKKSAIDELRQLYPEYLGYLKDEEFLTDKATVAYSKLIEVIYKKAKAAAYQKKFDKLVADEIELDEKIEEEKKHLKPESPRRVRRKIGDYEFEADVFEYDTTDRGLRDAKAKENIRKYEQELRDNYAKQSMYSKGIVENYVPNPKSGNKYRSSVRSVGLNTEQKKPREYNTTNIEPIDALGRNKQPVEKLKPLNVNAEMKKIKDEEDAKEALAQEKRKQRLKETSDAYKDFASEAIKAINAVYEAQLKMLDKEIEMRKERVSKAEELAERGNTEILRMEKEQLEKAQAEREKKAKQQLQLNALIQASNQAVALSEAIGAIVSAAAKGDPYTIALRVAAAVAALVAGIASLTGAFSNAHAYADGVVDFKGKGGPRDDANWVRISSGESVITAEGTRNNRQLLEAINSGAKLQFMNPALAFTMPAFASPDSSVQRFASRYDLKTVETKLDGVINAIEDNRMKQNIYFNEHGVGIMTERAVRKTKQRWM